MSDTMISAKAVVDAVPSGRQYLSEFYRKENLSDKSSDSTKYPVKVLCDSLHLKQIRYSPTLHHYKERPYRRLVTLDSVTIKEVQPHINKDVPGRVQEGLCVFESERMTFIDDWGEHYTVRIPCRLADAWALNTLVLLERQPNSREVTRDMPNAKTENPCPLFSMFSLTHPLDEVAPVILKVPLSSGGFGIGFVTDVNLKVIGIIPSLNMVLTYHSITKSHAVWQLEKALSQVSDNCIYFMMAAVN
ncbi:unnamed protein product [Trichobilharzia regenti]|nr:unnamed protein product [Trichobilharzia regenti]